MSNHLTGKHLAAPSRISMLRRIQTPVVIIILALALPPLRADEAPWEAIADDAAVVIRIGNPRTTIEKATELGGLVKDEWGDQIQSLISEFGESISNPKLIGVDRESSWWVAAYLADAEQEPAVAVLLPATDRKVLREAWGPNARIIELGKYVIYSTDVTAAQKTTARLKGEGRSISRLIDTESRALFDRGRLSVFINAPALPKNDKSRTDAPAPKVDRDRQGPHVKTLLALRDSTGDRMLHELLGSASDDLRSVTLTADVSKEGLTIDGLVRLRSGTSTARLVPKSTPEPFPELAALPPGGLIYAGAVGEWLAFFPSLLAVRDVEPDKLDKRNPNLEASVAALRKLSPDAIVWSTAMTEFEGIVKEAMIARMQEPKTYRKLARQIASATNDTETAKFRWEVDQSLAAERYGKNQADVATWRRVFRKRADAAFLPVTWSTRRVYFDDQVVETTGGDRQIMQDVLAALESNRKHPQGTAEFQRTRGRLYAEADAIVLIDAPKLCVRIGAAIAKAFARALQEQLFFGLLAGAANSTDLDDLIEKLELADSFCGLSATAMPEGVRVRAFVQLEQIQGFARILDALEKPAKGANGDRAEGDNVAADGEKVDADAEAEPFRIGVDYFDRHVFGGEGPEPVAAKRKQLEILLRREIAMVDLVCELSEVQKQKLQLAGRGDIGHVFERIGELRVKFEGAVQNVDHLQVFGRWNEEIEPARKMIESSPFHDGSTFAKTLKRIPSAEQALQVEAFREIRRVSGRVKRRPGGQEQLKEIDLGLTRFTDAGLNLLENLKGVQLLNLDSTRVTDAGLVHLRHLKGLESLDLASTEITVAGLIQLRDLTELQMLNLRTTATTDAGLAHLRKLTKLRHVGLFGTQISDVGLAYLKGLKNLEVLLLGATEVSDAGLAHLKVLSAIEELGLLKTHVTDVGLVHLAGLTNLRILDLRDTPVTDAGLVHLRGLAGLKELYLYGTEVSDAGAAELEKALSGVKIYK